MAAVLFFRGASNPSPVSKAFRIVKRLVGAWLLFEAVADAVAIGMGNVANVHCPLFGDTSCSVFGNVLLWLRTVVYVAVGIMVEWIEGRYIRNKEDMPSTASTISSASSPQADMEATDTTIDQIVNQWMHRADRPYLREGITVMQVAGEMKISPRLLSQYINNVKHVNFNTWINQLKVAEVQRIIDSHSDESLAQIAAHTGFTDASAMSKTFKAVTGMLPSAYRNRQS